MLKAHYLFCLVLGITHTCLAYEEERPRNSLKAWNMAKSAEGEIAQHDEASLANGIDMLTRAIQDPTFGHLDYEGRLHILLQLSDAYQLAERFSEQEQLLFHLLENDGYAAFYISLHIALGGSYVAQGKIDKAEAILRELHRTEWHELPYRTRQEIVEFGRTIEGHHEQALRKAEQRYAQKQYREAIPLYTQALFAVTRDMLPIFGSQQNRSELTSCLQHRLAFCYFFSKDYAQALQLLSLYEAWEPSGNERLNDLFFQGSFLRALILQQLGWHQEAETLLARYRAEASKLALPCIREASWHEAYSAFMSGDYERALDKLDVRQEGAILLKARVAIEEGNWALGSDLLEEVTKKADPETRAYQEGRYLEGVLAFRQAQFDAAIDCLEEILAISEERGIPWKRDALFLLGWSYINRAKWSENSDPIERSGALEHAYSCFHRAQDEPSFQKWLPGMAHIISEQSLASDKADIKRSLEKQIVDLPPEMTYAVRLLCAKIGAESETQEEDPYVPLLQECYRSHRLYPHALYYSFLYLMRAGDETIAIDRARASFQYLQKSACPSCDTLIIPLQTAYMLLQQKSGPHDLAREILSWLLRKIRQEKKWLAYEEICLEFLSEATCRDAYHDPDVLAQAALTTEELIYRFPTCRLRYTLRHLLGRAYLAHGDYESALEQFSGIQDAASDYALLDEVLFCTGHIYDALGQPEEARAIRKTLFDTFPHSTFAPESYFRFFSEEDYLTGAPYAISHLKSMPDLMAASPFGVYAAYYVGLITKQEGGNGALQEAATHFEASSRRFEAMCAHEPPSPQLAAYLQTVALQSRSEEAHCYLAIANLGEESTKNYERARSGFDALKMRLSFQLVTQGVPIDSQDASRKQLMALWQESTWMRSRVLVMLGHEQEAREELEHLVHFSSCMGCVEGVYLIRGLLELAKLHNRDDAPDAALVLLDRAEQMDSLEMARELLLEIWITKSHAYRKKRSLDTAMTLLSRVINDDSVSSLRVQAMFLRAEIYELQRRRDLALKQLEAVSKKGGEWGMKASQKLREVYGYE